MRFKALSMQMLNYRRLDQEAKTLHQEFHSIEFGLGRTSCSFRTSYLKKVQANKGHLYCK
jgi:hypothetical protein